MECNRTLLKENKKKLGPSYVIDENKRQKIAGDIDYVANSLESFYKNYWLDSGTLLGIEIFNIKKLKDLGLLYLIIKDGIEIVVLILTQMILIFRCGHMIMKKK